PSSAAVVVSLVALLGTPARAATPPGEVAYAYDGRRLLRLDFDAGTIKVLNADAGKRRDIGGLAVRDDLAAVHLRAVDRRTNELLFYRGARGAGQTIARIEGPNGVAVDGRGNAFVVAMGSGPLPDSPRAKRRGPMGRVWTVARGGQAPGDYGRPRPGGRALPGTPLGIPPVTAMDGGLVVGDLLVLAQKPAALYRYPQGRAPRETLIAAAAFPSGAEPRGFSFAPSGEVLVSLRGGAVLRFTPAGVPLAPDF